MHSFKQEIFTDPDNLLIHSPRIVLHSMTDPQYLAKTLITCTLQVSYNIWKYKKLKLVEELQLLKFQQIHKRVNITRM